VGLRSQEGMPSVDSDDEAAYSGPPLSSTKIKLPMFFKRAGSVLDNDGDEMDAEDNADAEDGVNTDHEVWASVPHGFDWR
jgi:hypothetical protein